MTLFYIQSRNGPIPDDNISRVGVEGRKRAILLAGEALVSYYDKLARRYNIVYEEPLNGEILIYASPTGMVTIGKVRLADPYFPAAGFIFIDNDGDIVLYQSTKRTKMWTRLVFKDKHHPDLTRVFHPDLPGVKESLSGIKPIKILH